jgi:hypothetical protein
MVADASSIEVDSLEFSSLSEDLEESTAFRDETISYIKASLSSANLDDKEAALSRASNNATITSFKPVGEAISKVYTSCKAPLLEENV